MCVGISLPLPPQPGQSHLPKEQLFLESELGKKPLTEFGHVRIFINDIGKSAMLTEKSPHFAAGTTIVKARIEPEFKIETKDGKDYYDITEKSVEFFTVMHKLPAGTSPETGDWQYLVYASDAKTELKKHNLPDCDSCHKQWKDTDYVSREYLTDKQKEALQ